MSCIPFSRYFSRSNQTAEAFSNDLSKSQKALKAADIMCKSKQGQIFLKVHDPNKKRTDKDNIINIRWTTRERVAPNSSDPVDDLCVVCFERKANIEIGPCKHDSFCQNCVLSNMCGTNRGCLACPLCRTPISELVRLETTE